MIKSERPGCHAGGSKNKEPLRNRSRRAFVECLGLVGAISLAGGGVGFESVAKAGVSPAAGGSSPSPGSKRADESFRRRVEAAKAEHDVPIPFHPSNHDEQLYGNRIGNYSKGLPHNSIGEVDPIAYQALLCACASGAPTEWDAIPLGGSRPLTDPQSGLAFEMEGTDSHQMMIPPAPSVASAQRAGEMVEDYWMALLRDVPVTSFFENTLAQCACADLSKLTDFRGPKVGSKVTPGTLFRGFTSGDLMGPYVSQFFLKSFNFGALPVRQQYQTYVVGIDYLTDQNSWLAAQNGQAQFPRQQTNSQLSYLKSPRDLAAWVHSDVLYQAYFNACLYLLGNAAPLNGGNPYIGSKNQVGFGTFGPPQIEALLAEVATRALKAVWYQKWFVHRNERPEEFAGLVHMTNTGQAKYPLHPDVLHSEAANRVFVGTESWFLPMAFPEGCPTHPSYGAGHATVAGACVTILKAFFDDAALLVNIGDGQIVQPSEDGLSLVPYQSGDANLLTVGGELNKLAANVAIGRNLAGVHWRSDYHESLLLGEAVAISVLQDQRLCYNENFGGFTFHRFDGSQITV